MEYNYRRIDCCTRHSFLYVYNWNGKKKNIWRCVPLPLSALSIDPDAYFEIEVGSRYTIV